MEPIHIKEIIEVVDNWGRTDRYTETEEIAKILKDPESWTDDQTFIDDKGGNYSIDDLINKRVQVGEEVFHVIEDETTKEIMKEIHRLIDPSLKLKQTLRELIEKYPDDKALGESIRRLNLE